MAAALETVKGAMSAVQDRITETTEAVTNHFDSKRQELQKLLQSWLKIKFSEQAESLVDRLPGFIKHNLEDPEMPGCVKRPLFKVIDKVWPDFRQEILWEMRVMIDGDQTRYEQEVHDRDPPDCIRAFLRYRLFPYNRGIWSTMRDPIFLIVNILALVPYMGIYAYVYLFIFLVIDKFDEYQLVYFILSFKGAQFFSWGLVKGIVGFTMYFMCVTFPNVSTLTDTLSDVGEIDRLLLNATALRRLDHTCETEGPGMAEQYWVQITSWLLPLILVWIAFLLLPFSKEKGRSVLHELEDEDVGKKLTEEEQAEKAEKDREVKKQRQGGYIRKMLIFDFIIFVLCVLLLLVIVATQPTTGGDSKWAKAVNADKGDWQVHQTLFFCQFIYGLFSVVFIPFNIPLLQAVLTHSAPTAYDEQGRCVKFKGAEKPKEEDTRTEEEKNQGSLVSDSETTGLTDKFKAILQGKSVDLDNNDLRKRMKKEASAASSEQKPEVAEGDHPVAAV